MKLYGVWDELPADLADAVLEDSVPIGPATDPDTASEDPSDASDAPEVKP